MKSILPGKPLSAPIKPADIARMCGKAIVSYGVAEGVSSPCWLWTGGADENGYGFIKLSGRKRWVHRVAFEIFNRGIKHGTEVNHKCRVRRCFNPDHLEEMTPTQNRSDAGRQSGRVRRAKRDGIPI